MVSSESIGHCASLACILEATARKPGNVHPQARFADVDYVDFVLTAIAVGPVMELARDLGVGRTVLDAVRRCHRLVSSNTNLGMILLLAPLAAVPAEATCEDGISDVLGRLDVDDARLVYEAIRTAKPGGLGQVSEQDVASEPTMDLLSAMRLAAERDLVARQYANGFREVLGVGVQDLIASEESGLPWDQAVVRCHLGLMARFPDTLIARKRGQAEACESAERAAAVLDAGWPAGRHSLRLFERLDEWLRAGGHARNPGTTADLVAASLFVALREGRMKAGSRWLHRDRLTSD
jgi:triphosphoribosyl-dephospho-CoA synthase